MKIWNSQQQQQQQTVDAGSVMEKISDDTSTMSTASEGSNGSEHDHHHHSNHPTAVTPSPASKSALSGIVDSCDLQHVFFSAFRPRSSSSINNRELKTETTTTVIKQASSRREGDSTEVSFKKKQQKRKQKRFSTASSDRGNHRETATAAVVVSPPVLTLEEHRTRLLETSKKLLRTRGFSIRQQLQHLLNEESATLVQAHIRGFVARSAYKRHVALCQKQLAAAIFIQHFGRIWLERQRQAAQRREAEAQRQDKAACTIQKFFESHTEFGRNLRLGACIMIQSAMRRALVRHRLFPKEQQSTIAPSATSVGDQSATAIQSAARKFLVLRQFQTLRRGVTRLQAASRGRQTRRKLSDMDYAATPLRRQNLSEKVELEQEQVQEEEDGMEDGEDYESEEEDEESRVIYDDEEGEETDDEDDSTLPVEELDYEDRHQDGWFGELLQDIVGDFEDTWKEMTISKPKTNNDGATTNKKEKQKDSTSS